jgi:hypothetical protein
LADRLSLVPLSPARSHGYTAMKKEIVRGHACLKESFGVASPASNPGNVWPAEESIPGFREFFASFTEVCTLLTEAATQLLSSCRIAPL